MDESQGPLSRSEINLIGRAARQDWGLGPAVQKQLLQVLVDMCDPESEAGRRTTARTKISAAKAIAALMKLQLGQQSIDLARQKVDGKSDQPTLADFTAAAERRAEGRKRERGE